ncbi:MAG: RluA family pseudouridine synthase, partial [Phycisphaerales bacterium]|nr:RluA family pseudouridine synthase [Phycisphaerales bacterium]
ILRTRTHRRLDKYLAGRLGKNTSRTALQRYIREGNVTVSGRVVKPSYTISVGDVIDMMLPTTRPQEIPAEPIPLEIVYEDDDVLAVNKQANLIIHPARGNWSGTLVNALAYYFQKDWREEVTLPCNGEVFRPGIVHRLDRNTTGVILIAKTELALWRLGKQFEHRQTEKTYRAIVHGIVPLDEDIIDVPLGKHHKFREKMAVHRDTGRIHPIQVKEAVTRYKVLERFVLPSGMKFTYVELYPKTGRTHQLRVHMSHLGYPLVGDTMYGGWPLYESQLDGGSPSDVSGLLLNRQALHAHTIAFYHPRSEEKMSLTAPVPEDMQHVLDEIRKRC